MYVRRLRDRIPTHVRQRASKAGFREPDWYAGPLVDDTLHVAATVEDGSSTSFPSPGAHAELEHELGKEMEKARPTKEMRAGRPFGLTRLLAWARPARQADAG